MQGPSPIPSELTRFKASSFNSTDLFLALLALVFVFLLGFLMSTGHTHKNFNVVMGFEKLQETKKTEEKNQENEENPEKLEENKKTQEPDTQKKEAKKKKKKKIPAQQEEKTGTGEDIKVEETDFAKMETPKENGENLKLGIKNKLWTDYVENIKAKKYENLSWETVQRYGNAYLARKQREHQ